MKAMSCVRCSVRAALPPGKWCTACEAAFDRWVRQYAADIVWAALSGGVVLAVVGVLLPVFGFATGIGWGVGAAFSAWGTVLGTYKLSQGYRRRQFLGGALPRAYLPSGHRVSAGPVAKV